MEIKRIEDIYGRKVYDKRNSFVGYCIGKEDTEQMGIISGRKHTGKEEYYYIHHKYLNNLSLEIPKQFPEVKFEESIDLIRTKLKYLTYRITFFKKYKEEEDHKGMVQNPITKTWSFGFL